MKNKVICIYPKDESTNFLMPIFESLQILPNFIGYRCDTTSNNNKAMIIEALEAHDDDASILFFLGHGASNKLYGSIDTNGERQTLFDNTNLELLNKFNLVGVSCKSADFFNYGIDNYIGFGDITSDFLEVMITRELEEPNYLSWATQEDIENFKHIFVQIIVNTIEYTKCMNLCSIYRILELNINKMIANNLIERKIVNYRYIADMLFCILDEMTLKLTP